MRIYFLSSRPCALKVGGVFFGAVDSFERFAEINLSDRLFIEFIPENALPVSFFLTENIRFEPPQRCEVYLLRNAIAIYARDFPPSDFTLRPITQIADENCLATVFCQGGVHLSIQTDKNFFTSTLPPSFCECSLLFACALLFIQSPTQLAVYTKTGKQVFLEKVLSHSVEQDVLKARLPLEESLGRVADCEYALSETECRRTSFILSQAKTEKLDDLLPMAFFESVLIGANYEEFLGDELVPEKEKIGAFLGDFVAVCPTEQANCFALIRQKQPRLFEAAYYSVSIENGKIVDITT